MLTVVGLDGLLKRGNDADSSLPRILRRRNARQQDGEFVPAEPRDAAPVCGIPGKTFTDGTQETVARAVASCVINVLELVQVYIKEGPHPVRRLRGGNRLQQLGAEQLTVLQAGQRVKVGLAVQGLGLIQTGKDQ